MKEQCSLFRLLKCAKRSFLFFQLYIHPICAPSHVTQPICQLKQTLSKVYRGGQLTLFRMNSNNMWHVKRKYRYLMMLRAKIDGGKKHICVPSRQILEDSNVNQQPCRDKSLFSRKAARRETFRP